MRTIAAFIVVCLVAWAFLFGVSCEGKDGKQHHYQLSCSRDRGVEFSK
jgi:hypothetical protein